MYTDTFYMSRITDDEPFPMKVMGTFQETVLRPTNIVIEV